MTNAVANGASSTVSKTPLPGLRASAEKAKPSWKRDDTAAKTPDADGKPALKSGSGPRPGKLDQLPVVSARVSDEKMKPGAGPSSNARGRLGNIGGAAILAAKEEFGGNKHRLLFHPKRSIFAAGMGFIENLIRGRN